MQGTRPVEKIRKPRVRLGEHCRNVINAQARREGDLGHRGTPIDNAQQDVIEKSPVMVAGHPKQGRIPKPGHRNR